MANAKDCYATNFLDGFDTMYKRTADVLKSTNEIAAWFKKLAQVEEEYSKAILKLTAEKQKKGMFKVKTAKTEVEVGTLSDAWDSVRQEIENCGNKHANYHLQVLNDISQHISVFVKEKEGVRKKLCNEGMKLKKDWDDAVSALNKAKHNYFTKSKEADSAQASFEKAKTEGSIKPKELNKMNAKAAKALDIAKQADADYNKTLSKTNEKQHKFYTQDMPRHLNEFQLFEEERLEFLKSTFDKFRSFMSEFPPFHTKVVESLAGAVGSINIPADIITYAESAKTGVRVPSDIVYEAYNSDNPNYGNIASKPSSGAAGGGSKQAKEYGLTQADENLSADEKRRKLADQIEILDNNIRSETKSQKGLEKLVQFYASDPVAQKKAEGELEEQKKKIDNMAQQKEKVQAQLNELSGGPPPGASPVAASPVAAVAHQPVPAPRATPQIPVQQDHQQYYNQQAAAPAAEPYYDPSQQQGDYTQYAGQTYDQSYYDQTAAYDQGYTEQAQDYAPTVQARGLYDYAATNNTELNFKQGDILNISDQDDSGWWYAELNGVMGFIPSNYVELI